MAISDYPERISSYVKTLPDKPGVYQFLNVRGDVIYIGKAKSLKKRVLSYFTAKTDVHFKTKIMVRQIHSLSVVLVETESDALLLENNLIKKYKPKYNILLKDDKTFPWIVVSKEDYPRVFVTRNIDKSSGFYFGPYTNKKIVYVLIDLFRQLYKYRTCKFSMTKKSIEEGRHKICLEYHIGNCKGCCENLQSIHEYNSNIDEIKSILKGDISRLIADLKAKMQVFAAEYNFEKAQLIKDRLEILQQYQAKSTIVSTSIHNVDVFGFIEDKNLMFVNYLRVVNGCVIQSYTVEVVRQIDEAIEDTLSSVIFDIRNKFESNSKEIIVDIAIDVADAGVSFINPKIGEKRKLLDLSVRNAKYYKLQKSKIIEDKQFSKSELLLERVKKDLQLDVLPFRIECFDNSNIQGAYPVAACVVFKNGKPAKKDYRHFNIKTVEGPDDFASMREILYRRYSRLKEEGSPLPQLVIVDGGKGQLSSAVEILKELQLLDKITVIGIAKRLEEIFFPGDSTPLYLDKNTPSLKLIQHLRNEAHRFGITFHRNQRSKGFVVSELDSIKGIGPKTKEALLTNFKSVSEIKKALLPDLELCVGPAKAQIIFDHFH